MLCKFINNQLKSHFFYKIPNKKKHVTFTENLISDLKSVRKNASEKKFNIGKLHCDHKTQHNSIGGSLGGKYLGTLHQDC